MPMLYMWTLHHTLETPMWPFTLVLFALVAGFFAGFAPPLPSDLLPLLVTIVVGFLAIKATEQYYQH